MAFSFGAASSSTPAFGAASTPAFGAALTPAFGAASTPAFGAASTPSFSFGSAPAFGAASAAASSSAFSFSSTFGASSAAFGASTSAPAASSTPAFGASTPGLFGSNPASLFGSSTPALGASSTPSLFGSTSTPALSFGSAPAFSFSSASMFGSSTAGSLLALPAPGTQQQQQQQPGALITYSTKYDELHPDRQRELQEIQREISSYRNDSEKLERDERLHDSIAMKKSMEEETHTLKQSLQGMLNAIKADDDTLADFREKVLKLLRSTEYAVRTFQRNKLWRDAPQQYKGQIIPPQVQELLASPVQLPSPYLEQAVAGFQQTLETYRQCISELEQALPTDGRAALMADESGVVQSLPVVVSHMHDYFVHVAAKMEKLHQEVQRCKEAFVAQRRADGDLTDPFAAARRYQNGPAGLGPTSQSFFPALTSSQHPHGHALPSHYHHVSTPHPGAHPGFEASQAGALSPVPFGTPLGGPVNPAAGDMSRKGTAGRRKK